MSNPITNDGRTKITKGCLQHRDLRGGLSPDHVPAAGAGPKIPGGPPIQPVQVPIIVLQSTENTLVSAANVDPFLAGRNTKHLWSHQLNKISEAAQVRAADPAGLWVGKRSTGKEDYSRYSILGKMGLTMLIDTLKNPRGAFVVWARCGHAIVQENKAAIMDLFDALVCPNTDYTGLDLLAAQQAAEAAGGTRKATRRISSRPTQGLGASLILVKQKRRQNPLKNLKSCSSCTSKSCSEEGITLNEAPPEPAKKQTALISFDQPSEGSMGHLKNIIWC